MLPAPRLVLFDLDGTLVDSVPDLAFCVDAMMARLGEPPRGERRVREWVGNGIEKLVARALTGRLQGDAEPASLGRALEVFQGLYAEHNAARSRLYPGVRAALAELRRGGLALGCVTNKAERFTVPLLKALGIYDTFGLVVAGDTLARRKPDPLPLRHAAAFFGVPAERALMVGDSMHDVQAARAAGFRVVCVSYGYNHGRDVREARPDAVVDSLLELGDLLDGWPGPAPPGPAGGRCGTDP